MAKPIDELTDIDYVILRYICKFDTVSLEQLRTHFSKKINALEYRLKELSKHEYKHSNGFSIRIENSSYIIEEFEDSVNENGYAISKSKNIFYMSPLGTKAVQDYDLKNKRDSKELWLKSVWFPMLVAFLTTILANWLLPKLPLILKWLADILSKNAS